MKIPWPWLALFTCSALRQDIEERRSSQDELSAVRAIASYHREGMSLALKNLVSVPPKSCGSILTSVLPVDPTFETQIRRKASLYFRIQTIKQNGKEVKVVYGKGTSWATEQVLGRLLKVGDFDATYMRSLQDFEAHLFRRKSPFGSVTFEVGTDLRSCWGDLYDWEDRKVCDVASLKDLLEDVKKQSEMKMDAVGKSGAAIVTNLRRFILKNLQEEEDPFLVREVIPNFATSIGEKDRDNAGCFKTAVAPICAVLDIPDAVHPGKRVHWVVMRKIELPGQQRSYFQLKDDDDQIDFQDLKGPKFTGLRDGKTFASKKGLGSAQVWHRKDAGFVSLFPTGMRLAYCGSKEAARTLQLDSEMLKNEQMTDYSLFLLPYERGNTRKCFCDDKPRWPLILDTDPYGLRMAVGIIDYLERKVSWFENMFGFSMSTMKEPAEYQNWWMRMWPTYFHLCDFKVNDQGQITGGGHTEQLKIGDRVVALEKIKWFGDVEEARSRQKFNGKWKKCYFGLAYEGSKYKVYPGAKGTVMSFESCRAAGASLVINWDKYKWRNKVFQVDPSSVMGEVRQLQRGLA